MNKLHANKFFVIDTNVLIHDPSAFFRFAEHNVFIPMVVLEELDAAKKGVSEVAQNARQASRFIDELIAGVDHQAIESGLRLPGPNGEANPQISSGLLFLQTNELLHDLPNAMPGNTPDNSILGTTLALSKEYPDNAIILVSKDINLRIKARILGIAAEDYFNDKVLEDVDLLYRGTRELAPGFWQSHRDELEQWQENGVAFYAIASAAIGEYFPNELLYCDGTDALELIARQSKDNRVVLQQTRDYRHSSNAVWGINARNREQNFALNLLMDKDIEFVSLVGSAGTGKTLLALAAGLSLTMEMKHYREIIVTRVTVPIGEDIGFLPGSEEEKMTPWMGALLDNLEVLAENEDGGEWGRAATADLLQHRIKIRSLNFMRGRTFLNRYIIIDEAQNLTPKQMRTLITRAGPGTKMVCIGNIDQIDTPYLSATTCGLTFVVDRFRHWAHSGHVILMRGERSRLADYATQNL